MTQKTEIAGLLLYCHTIVFGDMDKVQSLAWLTRTLNDEETALRISKKFENKIMNLLSKHCAGKIKGRKNFAILTLIMIDPVLSFADAEALAKMVE
jgi:hypothetical protein